MVKRLSNTNQNSRTLINVPTPSASGDAANKAYVDSVMGSNSFITNEAVTGAQNGSNMAFTTSSSYTSGTLEVIINGAVQARTADFTETTPSSGIFTLIGYAPTSLDTIRVNYQVSVNATGNTDTVDGFHASATASANSLLSLDSNAKFSSRVLTNPIKFSVYLNSAQNGNSFASRVLFDTKVYDTGNNFDITTNKGRFTVPSGYDGFYHFDASINYATATSRTSGIALFKNGVDQFHGNQITSTGVVQAILSKDIQLVAGDYVEIYPFDSAAGAMTTGKLYTHFSGHFISST